MLCTDTTQRDLETMLTSDYWVAQQKVDGERVVVMYNGSVSFYGRKGTTVDQAAARTISKSFPRINFDCSVDGEVMGGPKPRLWLFDMPYGPIAESMSDPAMVEQLKRPFNQRSAALQTLGGSLGPSIDVLPVAETTDQKWDLFRWLHDTNAEGIVFRNIDSPYQCDMRSKGCVRWKFTKDLNVIVYDAAPEDDKESVAVACLDENVDLVHVGKVSRHGKQALKEGDVVSVRVLYASQDLKLVQPRILKLQRDVSMLDCHLDNVRAIVANKTVLASLPTGAPPPYQPFGLKERNHL